MFENCFLIIENSPVPLEVKKNLVNEGTSHVSKPGGDYILEGMFTNLNGEKNNNNRIYEKEMFLPFYEKCKLRAEKGSFLGECDHPKRFEVKYRYASHIIEKLWYDDDKKCIMGRIRILNNHPIGEMVKSLIDNGVEINVSSRSAGIVDEYGKVQLKEVFTWDLVTTPGFSGTNMGRVEENVSIRTPYSEGYVNLSEQYNMPSNVEIYDISSPKIEINEGVSFKNKEITNKNMDDKKFKKLFEYVNNNFKSISDKLNRYKANKDSNIELEYIKNYLTLMGDKINEFFNYHIYTTDILRKNIKYSNYQSKKINEMSRYNEYLKENFNKLIAYTEYLKEEISNNKNTISVITEHSDYLSEHMNNIIGFTEKNNQSISEEFKKHEKYSNYLKGVLEQKGNNNFIQEAKKNEVNIPLIISEDLTEIPEKIDMLIENVQQKNEEKKNKENFINSFPVEKRKQFKLLTEKQKQMLKKLVNERDPRLKEEYDQIWEEAVEIDNATPVWLRLAPPKYKKIWAKLDESTKKTIGFQANSRIMDSQEEIDNFWYTREFNNLPDLKSRKTDEYILKKLNEEMNLSNLNNKKSKDTTKSLYGISDEELMESLGLNPNN